MDWDLVQMDFPPGAPSAGRYLAIATMNADRDNATMPERTPVHLIGDVLGRDSGFVSACAYLSGVDPLLVYVPEIPVSREIICDEVMATYRKYGRVVIVASEGIREIAGVKSKLMSSGSVDAFGHPVLGGSADRIESMISDDLGYKVRKIIPGSEIRSSYDRASPVDIRGARAVGAASVRASLNGMTGIMPAITRMSDEPYSFEIRYVPVSKIANRTRDLSELICNGQFDITGFMRYASPLIGKLPQHLDIRETEKFTPKAA